MVSFLRQLWLPSWMRESQMAYIDDDGNDDMKEEEEET